MTKNVEIQRELAETLFRFLATDHGSPLTLPQLAKRYPVYTSAHWRTLLRGGQLEGAKPLGRWIIRVEAVEKFLAGNHERDAA